MIRRYAAATLMLLAGCASSYDPPMQGDHKAIRYQTDLQRCQKQASAIASRTANATPQSAVRAIFASDEPERANLRSCMESRGYHLQG